MKKKILNIGSVTKDIVIIGDDEYNQIGGAVYYQFSTFDKLKIDHDSIILIGKDELEMMGHLNDKKNIHKIITEKSMQYTNIYQDDNTRQQKAYFPKDKIRIQDIERLDINLNEYSKVILSPLSPYEIDENLIRYFKKSDIETILLIQGFIRKLDKNDNVINTRWDCYQKYLKYTDIISCDAEEFQKAFDISINRDNMKKFILENSLKIVIITQASNGSTIYTENEAIKIPVIKTPHEVDPTGLGDTYLSAFIAKKDESTLFNAGLYAAVCAKNKLENKGTLKTSKNKIEKEYSDILNHISQDSKWNYDCQ